jgi:hypothetical protein
LFKQSIELKERKKKRNAIDHSHTVHRSIDSNETNYRKKKLNDFFSSSSFDIKKKQKISRSSDGKERRNRRCTLKRKTNKKKMYKEDYFLRRRADEDRPVSVPVGSCCLELFDADCDG